MRIVVQGHSDTGKIAQSVIAFLAVAFAATAGLGSGAWLFQGDSTLVFGWMPLPFAAGIAYAAVMLASVWIYMFRFWPYR